MKKSRSTPKRSTYAQRMEGSNFLVSGLTLKMAVAFKEAAQTLGQPDADFRPSPEVQIYCVHSRRIAMFAEMLEIRPDDFLSWILGDYIESLQSPSGLLGDWADSLIAYKDETTRQRVQARVQRYLGKRRRAEQAMEARKASKKGGK